MESQAGKITFASEQCGPSYVNVMRWWIIPVSLCPWFMGRHYLLKARAQRILISLLLRQPFKTFIFFFFKDRTWLFKRSTSKRPVSDHLVRRSERKPLAETDPFRAGWAEQGPHAPCSVFFCNTLGFSSAAQLLAALMEPNTRFSTRTFIGLEPTFI